MVEIKKKKFFEKNVRKLQKNYILGIEISQNTTKGEIPNMQMIIQFGTYIIIPIIKELIVSIIVNYIIEKCKK